MPVPSWGGEKFLCPRRIGECRPGNGAEPHFSFACPLRNVYNQRVAKTEKSSDLMIYVPPFFVSMPVHATGFSVFTLKIPPQKRIESRRFRYRTQRRSRETAF